MKSLKITFYIILTVVGLAFQFVAVDALKSAPTEVIYYYTLPALIITIGLAGLLSAKLNHRIGLLTTLGALFLAFGILGLATELDILYFSHIEDSEGLLDTIVLLVGGTYLLKKGHENNETKELPKKTAAD